MVLKGAAVLESLTAEYDGFEGSHDSGITHCRSSLGAGML
jgi:hypothetical protein